MVINEKKYHDVKVYKENEKIRKMIIGRKSLAKFIVNIVNDKTYFNKKIVLSRK